MVVAELTASTPPPASAEKAPLEPSGIARNTAARIPTVKICQPTLANLAKPFVSRAGYSAAWASAISTASWNSL